MNASERAEREALQVQVQEQEQELREELVRLLPAVPAERVLSSGRLSRHKDRLTQLIDREQAAPSALPARESVHSRLRRPSFLAAAVAVTATLGVALTVGLPSGQHAGPQGAGDRAAASGGSDGPGGAHGVAAVTLDHIATVAMRADVEPVGDGQFVYVRSRVAVNEGAFEGPVELGRPHEREVWFSQRRGAVTDVGLIREGGKDWPIEVGVPDGTDPADSAVPAGVDRPTYAWLASLPTDPAALLELLYAEIPAEPGEDHDQVVFGRIGDLVGEQIMPAATAAAFYRAAARIPGVTESPDAVDAAGRHGIAIAREDTAHRTRTEWIFDRATLDYLGERTVLSRDTTRGKAGSVIDTTAVLERAVVDRSGREPASPGTSPGR